MNFHAAAFAGAFGCVVGSIPSYYMGLFGGRKFVDKFGKWILISHSDLDNADKWVNKYGDWAFFICRMLPLVRTFISFPAGVLRADFKKFIIFTFTGSLIWSYFLVYIGVQFGMDLDEFKSVWHHFHNLVVIGIAMLVILFIYKHVRHFIK